MKRFRLTTKNRTPRGFIIFPSLNQVDWHTRQALKEAQGMPQLSITGSFPFRWPRHSNSFENHNIICKESIHRLLQELAGVLQRPTYPAWGGQGNFQEEVRAELNIKQEAYLRNCKGLGMVEAEVQRKDRKWVGKAGSRGVFCSC